MLFTTAQGTPAASCPGSRCSQPENGASPTRSRCPTLLFLVRLLACTPRPSKRLRAPRVGLSRLPDMCVGVHQNRSDATLWTIVSAVGKRPPGDVKERACTTHNAHTHTHARARTHTHTHTHTHTNTNANVHKHTHPPTNARTSGTQACTRMEVVPWTPDSATDRHPQWGQYGHPQRMFMVLSPSWGRCATLLLSGRTSRPTNRSVSRRSNLPAPGGGGKCVAFDTKAALLCGAGPLRRVPVCNTLIHWGPPQQSTVHRFR